MRQIYGRLEKCVLSAGKTIFSIKFLVFGGANFIFMGARIFLKNCRETMLAAQLPHNYPHRGGNFERGKNTLSCAGEAIREAF